MQFYLSLGLKLEEAREEKGYSLEDLGILTSIDPVILRCYETALLEIDGEHLYAICNALDTCCADMLASTAPAAYGPLKRFPKQTLFLEAAEGEFLIAC